MPTLAEIRANARELADMTLVGVSADPDFVTNAQFDVWINAGVRELHDIITTSDPDTYFSTQNTTLDGSTNIITFATPVMRIRGVTLNPDTARRVSLKRFNFADRDKLGATVNPFAVRDEDDRRYRMVSRTQLVIEPKERCAGSYRIYYVPRPTALTADGTNLDDALAPWSEYVSQYAAAKALDKEESFQQAATLRAQMQQMRADILRAVVNDDGSADGIADVQGWE
jgi:hypothetical protein